jgi:hypothetical protein
MAKNCSKSCRLKFVRTRDAREMVNVIKALLKDNYEIRHWPHAKRSTSSSDSFIHSRIYNVPQFNTIDIELENLMRAKRCGC